MFREKQIACIVITITTILLVNSIANGQLGHFRNRGVRAYSPQAPMWHYYGMNPYSQTGRTKLPAVCRPAYAVPTPSFSNEIMGDVINQSPEDLSTAPQPLGELGTIQHMPTISDPNQNSLSDVPIAETPQPTLTDAESEVQRLQQTFASEKASMQHELEELRAQARASEERARAAERRARQIEQELNKKQLPENKKEIDK